MTAPIAPDLWKLLADWKDYTYGTLDHRLRTVDCSSLASSVFRDHYGPEVITTAVWRAINLSTPGVGPWDGIEALAAALRTEAVVFSGPTQPTRDALHAFQVWSRLGPNGELITDGPRDKRSKGHLFLWLSYGGWLGVVIEANSPEGVRVWDATGIHAIADLVDDDGRLVREPEPMDLKVRLLGWDAVAFVELT